MLILSMVVLYLLCAAQIFVAGPRGLDWSAVAKLARAQAPGVQLAQARRLELDAVKEHAQAPSIGNPELALTAGPGFVNPGAAPALEFMAVLSWPFDVARSSSARQSWADERSMQAELETADAARLAVGEALDLFARSRGAAERIAVAQARVALDAEVLRIAQVRRQAGDVGEGDVALARVLRADGAATLRRAEGEHAVLMLQLAMKLGLTDETFELRETSWPDPPALATLMAHLNVRPDVRRALAAQRSAHLDHTLQERLGWPVPRVNVGGGRGPEYQAEIGLTVPLPIYQRNQIGAAVAQAHMGTTQLETTLARRSAAYELRAAYVAFESARAAHGLLSEAQASVDDAEHLAVRAFELGQDTLARAVVTRREVTQARIALQEAKLTMARARIALCVAAGTCETEVAP